MCNKGPFLTIIITDDIAVKTFAMATTDATELKKNPIPADAMVTMYSVNMKIRNSSTPPRNPARNEFSMVTWDTLFKN